MINININRIENVASEITMKRTERKTEEHISCPVHFSVSYNGLDITKQKRAKPPVILRCRSNDHHVYLHVSLYMSLYASRTQWPRRRRSASTRLLGLRVRIPPMACTSAFCKCCVLSGRGLSFVQRSPIVCGVSECDHEASIMRSP